MFLLWDAIRVFVWKTRDEIHVEKRFQHTIREHRFIHTMRTPILTGAHVRRNPL